MLLCLNCMVWLKSREAEDNFLKAGREQGQMHWFSGNMPL
jgi:hypothetical protein